MTNVNLISATLAKRMMSCIEEYELIKSKKSERFTTVKSFCIYHKFSHQNFMKIYHRYKQCPEASSLFLKKEEQGLRQDVLTYVQKNKSYLPAG